MKRLIVLMVALMLALAPVLASAKRGDGNATGGDAPGWSQEAGGKKGSKASGNN